MPRRILLFVTDLQIGGTPTVVCELAVRLRDANTEVEVACLSTWGPVADRLRDAGVRVTALSVVSTLQGPLASRRLVALIRRGSFDVVMSFLVHANAVAAVASRFCRHVRFVQCIQTTQDSPRWHWAVQSVAARAADCIVTPTESAARAAICRSNVPAEKIVVIPNAVDVATFPLSNVPAEAPTPYPIGFIGRLDPVKRLPDLLDAVAMLRERVRLDVYGEGDERKNIESQIDRLNLNDCVLLHGAIARPQSVLTQMGLLVLPSMAEGFGLVLIEAMAAGVPVVATRAPGICDVIVDGKNGLLVDRKSPAALRDAIVRIVEDPSLRSSLIDNGIECVTKNYSWGPVLDAYRRVLRI